MSKLISKFYKSLNKRIIFLKKVININSQGIDNNLYFRNYYQWILKYDTLTKRKYDTINKEINQIGTRPLISIILNVRNPTIIFINKTVNYLKSQLYPYWELCIPIDHSTDIQIHHLLEMNVMADSRIKYSLLPKHINSSTTLNFTLDSASGDYTVLLGKDDLLTPDALYWIALEIIKHPDSALIYSDEDIVNENNQRCNPYFKCDFNYSLFLTHNMIGNCAAYKTNILKEIGGLLVGLEQEQNYDLGLRITEQLDYSRIYHIPKVLYHRRNRVDNSGLAEDENSINHMSALKAVNEHLLRINISAYAEPAPEASGMNRIRYRLPSQPPSVDIIILTRDKPALLHNCIQSILDKTTYPCYSITIIDNGSIEKETFDLFTLLNNQPRISVIRDDSEFNYSKLNNQAVIRSGAEFVCLMNNDIEIITGDWLEEMVGHGLQKNVGAVGARLWYPNKTLQHGGIILGIKGVAGHAFKNIEQGQSGYYHRACLQQEFSAVTAACMLVHKHHYINVGGLDEINLTIAFNDVDFCLKLREKGLRNLWTPYAEMYHHESASRGSENTKEKKSRIKKEIMFMKQKWAKELQLDPAYNPNLTFESEDFSLSWPPREVN